MTALKKHRERQVKIVATLGPATSTKEKIRALFDAGADMFRLNFSHGTHADHRARLVLIREIEGEVGRPIPILADLQGPKLRLGTFAEGAIEIKAGQAFRLDMTGEPGTIERASMPHPEIFAAIQEGHLLLLDDGKVRLRVVKVGSDFADTMVEAGNRLSDRKGVNVPDVVLPLSALTPKDLEDLDVALDMGADWIALSFVQRPEDIDAARAIIGNRAAILAKLEKPSAIQMLEGIMERADGFMVARGDLGVEMLPEEVPAIQKRIVREARHVGKPVIVATQMLESMITAPTPTRAEASDVATAVYDGADAVMLSAETASGDYPIEAVQMMDRIARRTQQDPLYHTGLAAGRPDLQKTTSDAITSAARQVAETVGAVAIVTYTTKGVTTLRATRERTVVPILCLTPKITVARRLALSFGVHAIHAEEEPKSFAETVPQATRMAFESGLAKEGDLIVITAGVPFGKSGSTNILRVAQVQDPEK